MSHALDEALDRLERACASLHAAPRINENQHANPREPTVLSPATDSSKVAVKSAPAPLNWSRPIVRPNRSEGRTATVQTRDPEIVRPIRTTEVAELEHAGGWRRLKNAASRFLHRLARR
jgi:hypothetical protein